MIDYHIHIEQGGLSLEWLKQFWEQAQRRGIHEIGITEHNHRFQEFKPAFAFLSGNTFPYMEEWLEQDFQLSFAEYIALLRDARAQGIPVKIGLEVDYVPNSRETVEQVLLPYELDYLLGSVHILDNWGFDHSVEHGWEGASIDKVYARYYEVLLEAVETGMYDILAHFDVVKLYGHRPTITFYDQVDAVLQAMQKQRMALEVSTAGLRKQVKEMYPAEWILNRARELQVPITIASDAHTPEDVGYKWEQAVLLAQKCGYREYMVYCKRKPFAEKLPKLS